MEDQKESRPVDVSTDRKGTDRCITQAFVPLKVNCVCDRVTEVKIMSKTAQADKANWFTWLVKVLKLVNENSSNQFLKLLPQSRVGWTDNIIYLYYDKLRHNTPFRDYFGYCEFYNIDHTAKISYKWKRLENGQIDLIFLIVRWLEIRYTVIQVTEGF